MFSLGCSCGLSESQTPLSHQQDCFSYVVSVDGVHVCYPQNIIEYENPGEDEIESGLQSLVEYESTEAVVPECDCCPRNMIEHENIGEDEIEDDLQSLAEHENAREDEIKDELQNLAEYENTGAAVAAHEYPCSLLHRRGRSLSGMRLSLSISTQSTLVDRSGHLSGESDCTGHPHSKSGNYELIKQIGIDGEGVIHLMRTRSTRQLIARKTVSYARSAYAKPIEAFILQDVFPERHDNIIRLHAFESYQAFDSYQVEGARYYFEYCSGGDLHQLVDQYREYSELLPELFIWQAYQQLASALEFLHRGFDPRCSDPDRRGICHRDVKPSNVFLRLVPGCEYPDVVLADFGHATLDFATYDPAGTFLFQPPELPRHSPKGDVYSLGAVIHFLIHFRAPIAKLPDGLPDTQSVRDAWESAPEARAPIMEYVDGYSKELIILMLIALEGDENKRKSSSTLSRFLSAIIQQKYPPGSDLLREAEEWPMAEWAFDHMKPLGGRIEEDEEEEEEEEETGAEEYFDMMKRFGCCVSRESSRCSSPAPSDRRRSVAGRSSRGWDVSSVSSLGQTY